MIHRNTWAPDTCDCQVTYEWDDAVPAADRVHTVVANVPCAPHVNVPLNQVWARIIEENHRKNDVLDDALRFSAKLGVAQVDELGRTYYELKPGVTFRWEFDPVTRTMTVYFDGVTLTANERRQLQQRADQRYGPGVVVLG